MITNGKKGTIAFLGETEFSTGEWIGIVVRDGGERAARERLQGACEEWGGCGADVGRDWPRACVRA